MLGDDGWVEIRLEWKKNFEKCSAKLLTLPLSSPSPLPAWDDHKHDPVESNASFDFPRYTYPLREVVEGNRKQGESSQRGGNYLFQESDQGPFTQKNYGHLVQNVTF